MQNAAPDSPRFRRPALAGLTLAMLAAASPAAADGPFPSVPPAAAPGPAELRAAGRARPHWPVWPTAIPFSRRGERGDRRPSPVGLAFRLTEDVSLGAGGGYDPVSGEVIGLIALDIRF